MDSTGADGGTLTMLLPGDLVGGWDPASLPAPTNQSAAGPRLTAVYDALVTVNTAGEVQYRQAESMESTDATTWTVKLRPGLQFSDGTPLDAEAVRFNWSRIADPATESPKASIAQDIASMSVLDATTLEVTLAEPNAFFPSVVALNIPYVASPTALQENPDGFIETPVGAGPFVLKEWVRDSQMVFDRSPTYSGEVHLDQLVIKTVPDPTAMVNTLMAGDGDLAWTNDLHKVAELQNSGFETAVGGPEGGMNITFNLAKPPFDDIRARRAVTLALDSQRMNDALTGGLSEPVETIFTEASAFYDPTLQLPTPDAQEAQALLDELAAEGKPLRFTLSSGPQFANHASFIQGRLAEFDNLQVEVDVVGSDLQSFTESRAGNFEATAYINQLFDPTFFQEYFDSSGAANIGKYQNPEVDSAFATALASLDPAAQKEAIATVQEQIIEDVPVAFTLRFKQALAYKANAVGGLDVILSYGPDWTKIRLTKAG